MGIIERYNALKVKAISKKSTIEQYHRSAQELSTSYKEEVEKLKSQKESYMILDMSIQSLKEIIDGLSRDHLARIEDLLTYALQTIFYDKQYSVEIQSGDKRNAKTVDFYLVEQREKDVLRSSFNDEIGGGILSVCGFVLQVFYLGYLGQSNVMFCDESFTQVSDRYIDNLISFVNELSEKKGFIFVLVSHDTRLIAHSRKTYQVEGGEVSLIRSSND